MFDQVWPDDTDAEQAFLKIDCSLCETLTVGASTSSGLEQGV